MKAILVHLHIYYVEMWEELKNCLKNIEPNPYDLYVTIVEPNDALEKDILGFKPDAKIEVLENRGYDIAPFIHTINKLNLDNYEYIIKLHTKRDVPGNPIINGFNLKEEKWRQYLVDFISRKEKFKNTLEILKNDKIGMVSNYRLLLKNKKHDKTAEINLVKFLKAKGFPHIKFKFVAGTMFIAKANIFKPLQNIFVLTDFEKELKSHGQLAHLLERFLGYLVYYNKQYIYYTFMQKSKNLYSDILHSIYIDKITKSNKRLIKICKIPVYSRKLKK